MMLKENLLDLDLDDDDEHSRRIQIPDEPDLDEAMRRWQVDRAESSKERYARLAAKEQRDMLTLVLFTCVIALYIASSAMSFLATSSRVLELMFALSILGGPIVLYQRLSLTYYRLQREFLGEMWERKTRLKQKNDDLKVNVEIRLQKTIGLKKSVEQLKAMAKKSGHSCTAVMDLYNENQALLKQRKEIVEAEALVKMTRIILAPNVNRDHIIGETELNLLALRVDAVVGSEVPFAVEELCNRFRRVQLRSILNLAATAQMLFIEKKRQQEKNFSRRR